MRGGITFWVHKRCERKLYDLFLRIFLLGFNQGGKVFDDLLLIVMLHIVKLGHSYWESSKIFI